MMLKGDVHENLVKFLEENVMWKFNSDEIKILKEFLKILNTKKTSETMSNIMVMRRFDTSNDCMAMKIFIRIFLDVVKSWDGIKILVNLFKCIHTFRGDYNKNISIWVKFLETPDSKNPDIPNLFVVINTIQKVHNIL